MKYGFEKEFWPIQNGEVIVLPRELQEHMDECGFLLEARGEAMNTPLEAQFSLLYKTELLRRACGDSIQLDDSSPARELSKLFRRNAARQYGKREYPNARGNLYGLDYPPEDELSRAGFHVHFSGTSVEMDMPKIIRTLDEAFKEEIEAAQRVPGFYEMKHRPDVRETTTVGDRTTVTIREQSGFEYRSLPSNVDLTKLVDVLNGTFKVRVFTYQPPAEMRTTKALCARCQGEVTK